MKELLHPHAIIIGENYYIHISTRAGTLLLMLTNKRRVKCRECGCRIPPTYGIRIENKPYSGFLCYQDFRLIILKQEPGAYRENVLGNLEVGTSYTGNFPTFKASTIADHLWRLQDGRAVAVEV